ncbi:hypothetical protein [Bradyrhizobium sp. USDA 4353]
MSKEFELARLAMVRAAKAGEIDPARGFAWTHRIHPARSTELEETFAADFKIGEQERENVWRRIDAGWRAGQLVSFYDLEGLPGEDNAGLDRWELITVCRLAFLDRRFDDAVWRALTVAGSGPIESQGLADPFSMEDDINY